MREGIREALQAVFVLLRYPFWFLFLFAVFVNTTDFVFAAGPTLPGQSRGREYFLNSKTSTTARSSTSNTHTLTTKTVWQVLEDGFQEPDFLFADGRDQYTLMDRKWVNRQMNLQLKRPGESTRVIHQFGEHAAKGPFFAVANVSTGYQPVTPQLNARFHGYFLIDSYASLALLDILDLNLNLIALNPSASDGFRFSAELAPGFNMHLHAPLIRVLGDTVWLNALAVDLDLVTLGKGLLIEQLPLEGAIIGLKWRDLELKAMEGGRVFYQDDDLLALTLTSMNGLVGIEFIHWLRDDQRNLETESSSYVGSFLDKQFGKYSRLAFEYLGKPTDETGILSSVLVRGDIMNGKTETLSWHLGYQFRAYQRGFAPNIRLNTPSTAPNTPLREQEYVTNFFEYTGLSARFDQWSHTWVSEVRYSFLKHFSILGLSELWWRNLNTPDDLAFRVYLPRLGYAPGSTLNWIYRLSLEIYPFSNLPHRVSAYVTNKTVDAGRQAVDPYSLRYSDVPSFVIRAEAFL